MANLDFFKAPREIRELNLLQELEKNPVVSQRELSEKLGIALGVTNACLRRMVQKGWIQVMNQSYHKAGYFLTPRGAIEKTRIRLHLILWTMHHYSTLKEIIGRRLLEMQLAGIERIVFYGVGDEMEIALIMLHETDLKLVGIVEDDEKYSPLIIFGYEIEPVSRIRQLRPDSILITSLADREKKKDRIRALIRPNDIYISDIFS
jgi:DNA-binding Lrp family transcriptional regulator